jgi:class 3 adenylate cyclase
VVAGAETRYVSSSGYQIAYQVHGDGPVTILSLDQWPSHCEADWDEVWYSRRLERLGRIAQIVRFDARGSGLSDPVAPGTAPSVDDWADDAVAVLDAVCVATVAVWAGGPTSPFALHFAAREGGRVEAMVLSNPFARLRYAQDHSWGLSNEAIVGLLEAVRMSWGTGVLLDIYGMVHDQNSRQVQARYERLAASPGTALTLAQALCNIDVRDDLPAISSPTLIRMQANPVLDARHGQRIAAQIQHVRVEEAEDDWRWMSQTDPEVSSLAAVADFVGLHYYPHPYRMLATVLFTDIVGSTQTAAEIGDDRWRLLVDAHNREVDRQVAKVGGQIAHWTGDGMLAVFATPTMALRAAIAIRDALAVLSVQIRAGLHTGETEQLGLDVHGLAVHIGARVVAMASSGEILVSSTVREAVIGSEMQFTDRGTHSLKGVPDLWHLFALSD